MTSKLVTPTTIALTIEGQIGGGNTTGQCTNGGFTVLELLNMNNTFIGISNLGFSGCGTILSTSRVESAMTLLHSSFFFNGKSFL